MGVPSIVKRVMREVRRVYPEHRPVGFSQMFIPKKGWVPSLFEVGPRDRMDVAMNNARRLFGVTVFAVRLRNADGVESVADFGFRNAQEAARRESADAVPDEHKGRYTEDRPDDAPKLNRYHVACRIASQLRNRFGPGGWAKYVYLWSAKKSRSMGYSETPGVCFEMAGFSWFGSCGDGKVEYDYDGRPQEPLTIPKGFRAEPYNSSLLHIYDDR